MLGVENRDVVRQFEVGGGHGTGTGLGQTQHHVLTAAFELEDHALEVEQNVDHVFDDAVDLGVFVNDADNGGFGRGIAHHRGEQDAAQRIAERVTVAALKGFERNDGKVGVLFVDDGFDRRRLQERRVSHVNFLFQYPRLVTPIRLKTVGKNRGSE